MALFGVEPPENDAGMSSFDISKEGSIGGRDDSTSDMMSEPPNWAQDKANWCWSSATSPGAPVANVNDIEMAKTADHERCSSKEKASLRPEVIPCTAGGKIPQESNFEHCPIPQGFVRCERHHRAQIPNIISEAEAESLRQIWWRYHDDLTWPWYDKKPEFSEDDFETFFSIAQKVVDAMVAEYCQPMVLDQATVSRTNHIGHPPHSDNVMFDSVWWNGKKIKREDEAVAAQEGAYILWAPEKTHYRCHSCTIPLAMPSDYTGGEVMFYDKWGDEQPSSTVKADNRCATMFCGCQRNIHAVSGVTSGFRLVFLVWTRPTNTHLPPNQSKVCYFRPGTGAGIWLTPAEVFKHRPRKRDRNATHCWLPKDVDDLNCKCLKCVQERKKLAWSDCTGASFTPSTSPGDSPRASTESQPSDLVSNTSAASAAFGRCSLHCPHPPPVVYCGPHHQAILHDVLSNTDIRNLHQIWYRYNDDLTWPWYDKKPEFSDCDFNTFYVIAMKAVTVMAKQYGRDLVLDQATISNTNHIGHPPHADNVQVDSVWWEERQIKQRDELVAARGGAEVMWRQAKTSYRNYSASICLVEPWKYGGGDLEFYAKWGDKSPSSVHRCRAGSGVAFCGCQKSIHAVTGVQWGFRLVLLIWARQSGLKVPQDQKHVCYFRPGTGSSVWLTAADLEGGFRF